MGQAMQIIGTGMQAFSAMSEGEDKSRELKYDAAVANANASRTRDETNEKIRRQNIMGRRALGDIRSSYAASGVEASQGSALDVLESSAANAEYDHLMLAYQGELKARGFNTQAYQLNRKAENALDEGYTRGAAILLAGGGQAYSMGGSSGGGTG